MIDILLVDDSQDDLDLTLTALRRKKIAEHIAICRDGAEALDFVFGTGAFSSRDITIQPRLILLDLKLPKIDGLEVLRRIKSNPETQGIPVVMLTSSSRKADLDAAYKAGANSYLVKSVDFRQFTKDVEQLGYHWLGAPAPDSPS
jgi:CheY-like chemotaxis protein